MQCQAIVEAPNQRRRRLYKVFDQSRDRVNAGVAPDFVATAVKDADASVRVKRDTAHNTFRRWTSRKGAVATGCRDSLNPKKYAKLIEYHGVHRGIIATVK